MFSRTEFTITDEELQKIEEWNVLHECTLKPKYGCDKYVGAIGGIISITFLPTSIGTIVYVKCACGKEFTVRGLM
jgi:hypothetical protein